jgi:3-deoxy-7-phosphoheptulonate synthase
MVPPLAGAAVAVGADGLLVEVHCKPYKALSDGEQSLTPDRFELMMHELKAVAMAVGRRLT